MSKISDIGEFRKKIIDIQKQDWVYMDTNPTHYLIIATTRAGKSQSIVMPQIDLYSRAKTDLEKASMVISDPKGELFENTSASLIARGYKVIPINVIDYNYSYTYNPLSQIVDGYLDVIKCFDYQTELKIQHEKQEKIKIQIAKLENLRDRSSIQLKQDLKDQLNSNPVELLEKVYDKYHLENCEKDGYIGLDFTSVQNDILDLVGTLCPIISKDPFWEQSAQKLLASMIHFVLESGVSTGQIEQVNLYNVSIQINKLLKADENDEVKYFDYLETLRDFNFAKTNFGRYSLTTLQSILGTANASIQVFNSEGIGGLTSKTQIDFEEIVKGNDPYAIFLMTPDYKTTFNKLISIFVNQIYMVAAKYADSLDSKRLKRKLIFILDEFANIPKIPDLNPKLTVSLGRAIQFILIVQNLSQIKEVYGEETMDTLNDNSHNKLYLLSADEKSRNWFSKQIGSTTIVKYTISGKDLEESSITWAEEEKPLVTDKELELNPMGTGYLSSTRNRPSKVHFRMAFQYMGNEKQNPKQYFENEKIKNLHTGVSTIDIIFKKDTYVT